MQLLSYFLRKYRFFLFFVFLELIALSLIIQNHSFHKSKFVSSANTITGGIYERTSSWKSYFTLTEDNKTLVEENLRLKQLLEDFDYTFKTNLGSVLDTITFIDKQYVFRSSKVVKNSYHANYNFLLINTGVKDSIKPEMAVCNDKGVIGITEKSSKYYTRVQSILNIESNINAKLKNNNYYGSLTWNGKDYNIVQLIDVERQAPVRIGDTIVTGGRSAIFPEGIPIGTVIRKNQNTTITSSIDVELFNDMSNIRNVYIIENKHQKEIRALEAQDE